MLGALESRSVTRVGSDRKIPVDIRLISATNLSHEGINDEQRFRKDLLYRINTVEILLPPLRERTSDIPLLARHYVQLYANKYNKTDLKLEASEIKKLQNYSWPGNIRELENFTERFVLMVEKPTRGQLEAVLNNLFEEFLDTERVLAERDYASVSSRESDLKAVVAGARYTKGEAAKKLGISRTTLWRRLKRIEPDQ